MAIAPSQALLLLIAAPSGAGKTTISQQLLKACPGIVRVITCTTRKPRKGEQDGVDYHFLSADVFRKRMQADEFLEHATVFENYYGTLKSDVLKPLRAGQDVLLSVDVQGVANIRAQAAHNAELERALVTVFLTTPTFAELEKRLRSRATDSEEAIQRRLKTARQEIAQWESFDYLLISDTRAEDLRRMRVIIEAEKLRQSRSCPPPF